jgi:hypothetical protein
MLYLTKKDNEINPNLKYRMRHGLNLAKRNLDSIYGKLHLHSLYAQKIIVLMFLQYLKDAHSR